MNTYQQKHTIALSGLEYQQLQNIIRDGNNKARTVKRAEILLKSYAGAKDKDIATQAGKSSRTVERVRKRYVEGGLSRALYDAPRSGQPSVLDDKAEAYLVATACSTPPEGYTRWTLELLRERMLQEDRVKHISTVAIWGRLTNRGIKPWREKNVVYTTG